MSIKLIDAEFYDAIGPIVEEYDERLAPLLVDFYKKCDALFSLHDPDSSLSMEEYDAKRREFLVEYQAQCAPITADYEKKRKPIDAKYIAQQNVRLVGSTNEPDAKETVTSALYESFFDCRRA